MESSWPEVTSVAELAALLGEPTQQARDKDRDRLVEIDQRWLAASPFCLVATSAVDGTCDVSPKGDPPGFTLVIDERTIALPERPGNRRADGFRNLLDNPGIGLIYLVPGRTETLRINGRARIVRDAPFFDRMVVKGHRPVLATVVDVEQVFFHCGKAFLRSELWQPASWHPEVLPSTAAIIKSLQNRAESLAELEARYRASHAEHLYG